MSLSRFRGQIILAADVCLIFMFNFLLFLPALLRDDIRFTNLMLHIGLLTVCVLVFQLVFRTYNTLWRYAESREYFVLLMGMSLGFLLYSGVNLLLDNETDPVIWRGPVIGGVVQQFWSDVLWQDVDYMFVDMPPGTGDVALNVFQSLPVDGVIIVTSPQELVSMVVEKAVKMAQMMNIPVLGLVENMSYLPCPDCGKKIYLFGEGKTEEAAARYGLPLLAKMPLDPTLAELVDAGEIENFQGHWLDGVVEKIIG